MIDPMTPIAAAPTPHGPGTPPRDPRLWGAAQALEASFLAEMLKSAGVDAAPGGMGSGAGQDAFAPYLLQAQAERIVAAGGIGLAESIYAAMQERGDVPE
ncbi:MAG: Rod binding protein [Rhodobacteraceae bacterium HLUCCA08]|nr:MAG: Rod binding protein [Rhodobacteraceae bacterium HLUCCA08]